MTPASLDDVAEVRWRAHEIRPDSPVPLYFQLELILRRLVETQTLEPGAALPSEAQLQERYGVSRITVRRAINELVREGLLVSRQGVGTFIADPAQAAVQCLASFTADVIRRGEVPGTEVLECRRVTRPAAAIRKLELPAGEAMIFLKRLRSINGEPAFISNAHLPERLVPGLTAETIPTSGIEQSIFHLLEQRYGVALAEGEEVTCAVRAGADIVRVFNVRANAPVVRKICLLRDRSGVPVLYDEVTFGLPQTNRVKWEPSSRLNEGGGRNG